MNAVNFPSKPCRVYCLVMCMHQMLKGRPCGQASVALFGHSTIAYRQSRKADDILCLPPVEFTVALQACACEGESFASHVSNTQKTACKRSMPRTSSLRFPVEQNAKSQKCTRNREIHTHASGRDVQRQGFKTGNFLGLPSSRHDCQTMGTK